MPAPRASQELGAFLRAHRELLKPAEVGLVGSARRRTPGLRREEVASLSGVGLAWYTWLEQGRVTASRQVLEAVGRTLRLDGAGLRHALRLAGYHESAEERLPAGLAEAMQPVLDSWPGSPAVLLDRYFDLLCWNSAWSALWGAPEAVPAECRNLMWLMAADPWPRAVLHEWEPLAMNIFQHFRAQAGPALAHPRVGEVYRRLDQDAPQLAHWWACHSVADLTARTLTAAPAGLDPIRLSLSSFRPVDDPSALVLLFTPVAAQDRAALRALADRPLRAVSDGRQQAS
ncbi:helix-turn-helix transcriptional regulator [Streptacidiphilus sp. P02-A3a]|uniref:helix-turn-helix transcriptional regulator n=1 Tax=Streptacidiphilus sp. P02-A3a TaxID=2704468 RepID=UPI0015F7D54E|nr:helix-turn-helix transcriptional regulator [Streptacidiphilus sp. P02-A3a]QMU70101.1 helix-turn-helix domain-containing protein [Streptacidiphilus sp. P02-A3a]QMU70446.1 helix-turn-helix domain-containing protein [Streptacidiphilus sp. P02-A3a]